MKNYLLFLMAIATLGLSTTNAQQIDPAKVKTFLAFEDNITDASSNSPTYTESVGSLTYDQGKFGKAAIFSEHALTSSGLGFNGATGFSICAWIKHRELPSVLNRGNTWIHQQDVPGESAGRIHLEVKRNDQIGSFTDGIRGDCPNTINKDTWYHVASVKTPSGERTLYVDGISVSASSGGAESNSGEIVIGASKSASGAWADGAIDDLLITTEILTTDQLTYIKDNGVAKALDNSTAFATPIANSTKLWYHNQKIIINSSELLHTSKLKAFSLTGQTIVDKTIDIKKGSTVIEANLPAGIYILELSTGTQSISQKIIAK